MLMDLLQQQKFHSFFICAIKQIGRGFDWLICQKVTSTGENIQIFVVLGSRIFIT